MDLQSLSAEVRHRMIQEMDYDIERNKLLFSARFTPKGREDYPLLLRRALQEQTISWLTDQLNSQGYMESYVNNKKVPVNAAQTFAEGEFNRFYCRGLCLEVISRDETALLEIYRAKPVKQPRPESASRIGTTRKAVDLLNDLRENIGVDLALGVPSGPNSGLSLRVPRV